MKLKNQYELIELAKAYVALSNAHQLKFIFPMFVDDASYSSSSVGEFEGRQAIQVMMTEFFTAYTDVNWLVETYRYKAEGLVEFEFQMTATDSKSGGQIKRKGLESIQFTEDGHIQSITVAVKN